MESLGGTNHILLDIHLGFALSWLVVPLFGVAWGIACSLALILRGGIVAEVCIRLGSVPTVG